MPLKRRRRRRGGRRRRDRRRRGRRGREGMLSSEKLRHFENLKEENKEMQVKFLIVQTSFLDFFLFSSDALCYNMFVCPTEMFFGKRDFLGPYLR